MFFGALWVGGIAALSQGVLFANDKKMVQEMNRRFGVVSVVMQVLY